MKNKINFLKVLYDIKRKNTKVSSMPLNIRLAISSVCNYRCTFCEIHKDISIYKSPALNQMTLDDVNAYKPFLSKCKYIGFYGGSAEPLMNVNFGEIVEYLKTRYGMYMMVTTNGALLHSLLARTLIKYKFDEVLLSYHAGYQELYKELTTKDITPVKENIFLLNILKSANPKKRPIIKLNFALQKLNAKEAFNIIDTAESMFAKEVHVYQYHNGKNLLQDERISFEYDPEEGNAVLDEIYEYAASRNVQLVPSTPSYWKEKEAVDWNPDNYSKDKKCYAPWKDIHFKPDLGNHNCHYVGVCNRVDLFRVNYKEIKDVKKIWNHPVLQHLRKTVNSKECNPVCKFCKNRDRERIRNVAPDTYAALRDHAVAQFFRSIKQNMFIKGLTVLDKNPRSNKLLKERKKND